ncbi:HAD family hydrolase [Candidatus Woesearchaeota archaeon]|nr:HAD family hydrolase [Candidatus Woesearchaeota archaeon]
MLKKLRTWIFRKKTKAVIFDYDGVLNDSLDIIRQLYNEFYARGVTKLYFKDNQEFSDFFEGDMWKNMRSAGMEVTQENKDKCNTIIKEVLHKLDPDVKLYPGVNYLLLKLCAHGYKIGIVSNGNREIIKSKLRQYGLDFTIDSIIGYEQVKNPKPSPEGLQKCLEELKVKPREAVYVGDMESDVQAAKAAKVKIIAVTYGYLKLKKDMREQLRKADVMVDTVDDIYENVKNG